MSYKIYTYADPYRINQTDFWQDIKSYPQLCASRTLTRGLIEVLDKEEIETLICPIDSIVNDRIFVDWAKNIRRRIQQHSKLGEIYRKFHERKMSDSYYEAFEHNKSAMLDSIRLFIELGISADSLDTRQVNMEHRVFCYLLKIFEKDPLFTLPEMPSGKVIKDVLLQQAAKEIEDKIESYKKRKIEDSKKARKRIALLRKMERGMQSWDGSHIVIHGIHQFSPLQLRFITHMEKLGIEIIFLYNYLPQFKEIYSSWNFIYQQFDATIHHDERIKSYEPDVQFQRPGNAIATNMGLICEENVSSGDSRIRRNYDSYKGEKVYSFDNISEYAGYVSDLFSEAERRLIDEYPARNQVFGERPSTDSVLARMDDVIYTANKEVDELLQVYHPEYSRNRHFLAYPIGQFFAAIYELWNAEKREINIDYSLLRECVNSGILQNDDSGQLLKTLMNVEPIIDNISSYSQFVTIFSKYIKAYKQVKSSHNGFIAFQLKPLNIYSSSKVTESEINNLYNAVVEINKAAENLFGNVDQNNMIALSGHFHRLRDFIKKKQPYLANAEERELVDKLMERLDSISFASNESGTIDDLKDGLYYFLKQKEEPVSDWFVKNFEQIDGDVLLSRNQNSPGREKVYHFACVSDLDMNRNVNELLPWPLSDMFIEKAYIPKEIPFQVYYASLCEHSNFLRYALFYGLYFSQCDTKISFVKRYGTETTDYYGILKLIGMGDEDAAKLATPEEYPSVTKQKAPKVESIKYERNQMATMMLCPFRFFLDYVMNPNPTYSGEFLLQKYYMNLIVENSWKQLNDMPSLAAKCKLSTVIDQQAKLLDEYFPFISETEKIDIKKQAENYIMSSSKIFNGTFDYFQSHMDLRRTFIKAKFFDDLQDLPGKHKYPAFESLSSIEEGKKTHSVHSVPQKEDKKLTASVLNYLNESEENIKQVGSWCMYCPDKDICLESYAEDREE